MERPPGGRLSAARLANSRRSYRLAPASHSPSELNDEQRDLDDTLRAGIAKQFQGFQTARACGRCAPRRVQPWLHEPRIGRAVWELTEAVSACGALPDNARQVAILATGARFKAAFELYAHVRIARDKGLAPDKIATITAGQRPADLSPDEAAVYDAATALNAGGVLPGPVYARVQAAFGPRGIAELIHLVGLYAMVCTTLNGFDVPIPDQQVDPAP